MADGRTGQMNQMADDQAQKTELKGDTFGPRYGWKEDYLTVRGMMTPEEYNKLLSELKAMTGDGIYFVLRAEVVT